MVRPHPLTKGERERVKPPGSPKSEKFPGAFGGRMSAKQGEVAKGGVPRNSIDNHIECVVWVIILLVFPKFCFFYVIIIIMFCVRWTLCTNVALIIVHKHCLLIRRPLFVWVNLSNTSYATRMSLFHVRIAPIHPPMRVWHRKLKFWFLGKPDTILRYTTKP